ncbi:hypothetical protein HPP92_014038 [Vanilla planifolia]|uniref:Uncharacterized protein n=1 Tax=Vanilla planifolia TaxID=51239 RepID=A0A835QJE4_VANPL|nr:hypothetical protein HPP92_014471 [Vanilla planifolia]KAG0472618.1 hypothetical protein HPP92_014475 [Vanilla planifolia]KAG0474352.1 hypothetical protein HPP92_014038 [Vanilla planifolia]
MSSSSASSPTFSLDHLSSTPYEQLCYVHCNFCDTVLAVSVPCSSFFKTVTVRCGHCTNLFSVNMRGLLLQSAEQLHLGHPFLSPLQHNLLDELACPSSSLVMDHPTAMANNAASQLAKATEEELPNPIPTVLNRPPEKRQRVPSAYNRFIKDEIQRIKAGNPDITHREAFSAAAKNWAHFPHIHFGLMADQTMKKSSVRQQEGGDVLLKDGFYAATAANMNMGIAPF